mgnify:CR=1 FL=1
MKKKAQNQLCWLTTQEDFTLFQNIPHRLTTSTNQKHLCNMCRLAINDVCFGAEGTKERGRGNMIICFWYPNVLICFLWFLLSKIIPPPIPSNSDIFWCIGVGSSCEGWGGEVGVGIKRTVLMILVSIETLHVWQNWVNKEERGLCLIPAPLPQLFVWASALKLAKLLSFEETWIT